MKRRLSIPAGWLPLLFFGLLLTACQQVLQPVADSSLLAPLKIDPAAARYRVQQPGSWLKVLVYRDGSLARLGHNHILLSGELDGDLYLAPAVLNSAAELRLPVASFSVDDPAQRSAAGPEFASVPDAAAIAGTRENMLGEQLLNAAVWPEITMRSRGIVGELPALQLQLELQVQDRVHEMMVPVQVEMQAQQIIVTGALALNQTDIGLTPFSVMLGALQVRDQLDVSFHIVLEAG